VRIRLDNSERILKPGMPADARIVPRKGVKKEMPKDLSSETGPQSRSR